MPSKEKKTWQLTGRKLYSRLLNSFITGESENVRQRKPDSSEKGSTTKGQAKKELTFQIEELKNVVTDFSSDGGFQKCVKFAPKFSSLATGGGDGFLRLWKVNWCQQFICI